MAWITIYPTNIAGKRTGKDIALERAGKGRRVKELRRTKKIGWPFFLCLIHTWSLTTTHQSVEVDGIRKRERVATPPKGTTSSNHSSDGR